jgi:hypothetical protein
MLQPNPLLKLRKHTKQRLPNARHDMTISGRVPASERS